jgi:hypothetical protein
VGNRGPKFGHTDNDYTISKTLEIHGPKNEWNGNICFNDNHILLQRTFFPEGMACVPGGKTPPAGDTSCGTQPASGPALGFDNIFNPDDTTGATDAYLCVVKQLTATQASGTFTSATIVDEENNWD